MSWPDREIEYANLRKVQQLLGEVSMIWAAIDRRLDSLICDMLDISFAETAAIVSGIFSAKKAEMVSRLITIDNPGPEWATEMTALLNEISEKMSRDRNRFIHDAWQFDEDVIKRIDSTARRVGKDKTELEFDRTHLNSIEEMKRWTARALTINVRLRELRPALLPWLLQKREALKNGRYTQ